MLEANVVEKMFVKVVDTKTRLQVPLLLEIIRSTDCSFITTEIFSIGLRDFSNRYMRKREVRWRRGSGVRHGENPDQAQFRIVKVLKDSEIDALINKEQHVLFGTRMGDKKDVHGTKCDDELGHGDHVTHA